MIDAVDSIDAFCANWLGDSGFKEQIERLARLAGEVVNDEEFSLLDDVENRIYDLAAEITGDLFEPLEDLENLYRMISKLEDLFPDDEDFDKDDEDEIE